MALNKKSVAVITGAGSGIGRALAVGLAELGIAGLVISDIDGDSLEETVSLLDGSPTKVVSQIADVSKPADIENLHKRAYEEFDKVTHLFNNAGAGIIGRVDEVSIADMEWLVGINFWGTVYGTKQFLPDFKERDHGHIINISSVFGLIAPPGQATYCATKFAVKGFTESLKHELDGSGVIVTSVHPGGIKTNIAKSARLGELAPAEDKEVAPDIFEKIAHTTAEQAAQTIIKGVKKEKTRILIGSDAYQISWIQRLFPNRYFPVLDRLSGGMLSKFR